MNFYRYRGTAVEVQGYLVERSTVFGSDGKYITLPSVPMRFEATPAEIDSLVSASRPFNQNTDLIFKDVNLKAKPRGLKVTSTNGAKPRGSKPVVEDPEEENKTPMPDMPAPAGVAGKTSPVPAAKDPDTVPNVQDTKANEKELEAVINPEPATPSVKREVREAVKAGTNLKADSSEVSSTGVEAEPLDLGEGDVPSDELRAMFEKNRKDPENVHGGRKALQYVSLAYFGGTPNDYKIVKLPKCGNASLSLKKYKDRLMPNVVKGAQEVDPDIFDDFQNNIIPALGFKIELPFDRLHVCVSSVASTSIHTTLFKGIRQGVIVINPTQIFQISGGYNSRTVAQAITHELAHFVDNTVMRNVARMKFSNSILGKDIHPNQAKMGAFTTGQEHFATIAELMVWGSTHRQIFDLSGFDIVNKYFVNRYITKTDLKNYGN